MNNFLKNFYMAVALLLVLHSATTAATLYSRTNGDWSTSGTWSTVSHSGASCSCTPNTGDVVIIGNNNSVTFSSIIRVGSGGFPSVVTVNANASLLGAANADFEVKGGGTLNVCGTLRARNLTFDNGSLVNVCTTGYLQVTGNFENKNNSDDVVINGNMTVAGNFSNGNGGVISGTGGISVGGTFSNTGTTFGCTGSGCCSGGTPCVTGAFTLPIELLYFVGEPSAENVKIHWATASEINNDYFNVERSIDGRNFESIARISGAGNTTVKMEYLAVDDNPINGMAYYRLKQTDFDGISTYSDIIAIDHEGSSAFGIYPNPTSNAFYITTNTEMSGIVTIMILDGMGKKVFAKNLLIDHSAIKIDEQLPKGVYILSIKSSKLSFTKKLIVQ